MIVLVATGWSAHWGSAAYLTHPHLSEEAATLLVERGVRTLGIDALSVDPTPAQEFPAHRVLCGAHAVIAENLTGLDRLLAAQEEGRPVEVSMLPLRLGAADGAPVRAVARLGRPEEVSRWVQLLDAYAGPDWVADRIELVASYLGQGPRGRRRYEVVESFGVG